MNTVLWLNAVTFSSPWANVDEPRSRSVVKTDYNRFKLATNARHGPKECVNGISAWGFALSGKLKVSRFAAPARRAWKLAAFVGALPAQSRRRALSIRARPTRGRETQFPRAPR